MVEIQNLRKAFGSIVAVDGVSFSVGKGEVLGFLGPNGAGKSTTMKMITGFLTPTSGTVRICGHDVPVDQTRVAPISRKKNNNTLIATDSVATYPAETMNGKWYMVQTTTRTPKDPRTPNWSSRGSM